ncbi:hypothetical protein GW916_14705 [bacterium]|nr:hypothetical protein [bacterium]
MIQYLRFLNLDDMSSERMPGDLRFWRVLETALPGISFYNFRGLGVEWDDSVDSNQIPTLETWGEWLCPPGTSSLGLSDRCEVPCVQRRKVGRYTTCLETLIYEMLERQGFPRPKSVWEAAHFETKGSFEESELEDNVLKLMGLGSKTGLFDEDSEELRFLKIGDSWEWTEDHDFYASLDKISVGELGIRWKKISSSKNRYDSLRRNYKIHEVTPAREKLRNRKSNPLFERVDKVLLDDASLMAESFDESANIGIFRLAYSKHSEERAQKEEISDALRIGGSFMDQPIALTCWDDRISHRAKISRVSFRQYINGLGPVKDVRKLYSLRPISRSDFLSSRRQESVFYGNAGLFSYRPWRLSGGSSWLGVLRGMLASHAGWQISEQNLRRLFQWELGRSAEFDLHVFASDWSLESVQELVQDYGLEVCALGEKIDSGLDGLRVVMKNGTVENLPWNEIIPDDELDASSADTADLAWQVPDKKTPTFGFEKVSVFPDQYLLRILKSRRRSKVQGEIDWELRSHSKAREVRMRHTYDTPSLAQKRSAGDSRFFVEAFKSGQNISAVDPKAASVWAIEHCYRELVARGVNPDSPVHLAFSVNRPQEVQASEKNIKNHAAFTLAVEGMLEAVSHTGMRLVSCNLEQSSNPIRDYECEPLIHLRSEIESIDSPIMPGFRMGGEILYALGPRPVFMDAGSRVLPFVRVASNHVSKILWDQQLDLYRMLYKALENGMVVDVRPIGHGGVAETLLDMALWSGIGIQLKPGLSTMELFSGAPGRFLVGVLPQEEKNFEALVKNEWLIPVGKTAGEKLFGLNLEDYREAKK